MLVVGSYETHHPDGEILDAENVIFIIELDVQVRGCRWDTLPAAAGKGASAAKLLVRTLSLGSSSDEALASPVVEQGAMISAAS